MFANRDYPATVFAFRKFAPTPHSQAARSSRVLLSVAAQIEADPELQGTPIIFLTALVTEREKTGLRI